jgi:hypothetical protein
VVRSHPRQIVHETLFQKHPTHKRTSGVVWDPEFKPQHHQKDPQYVFYTNSNNQVERKKM